MQLLQDWDYDVVLVRYMIEDVVSRYPRSE